MHTYTSSITEDEVISLDSKYDIPLDLRPCALDPTLTMNKLPLNAIVISDPPPTGVNAEHSRRLCENIIDLRPVHLAMLYEVGLTTIWKHVGQHPSFKDAKGTGKRAGPEGPSQRAKRKKNTPLSLALSDYTDTDSPPWSISNTVNFVIPITIAAPIVDDVEHDDNANVVNSPSPNLSSPLEHSSHSKRSFHSEHSLQTLKVVPLCLPLEVPYITLSLVGTLMELKVCAFFTLRLTLPMHSSLHIMVFFLQELGDVCWAQATVITNLESLQQIHSGCFGKEASLSEKVAAIEKEMDNLLDQNKLQEDHI
uniref:Uncharacterized protein n=1 Tax=Tanacetum cinerariifolium TaxID=118510 RepID=A0A6L2K6Q3_TANCI|nr:hypothetical protein [Tanacetum cinerariifolium]